jgi:hypothetical protein
VLPTEGKRKPTHHVNVSGFIKHLLVVSNTRLIDTLRASQIDKIQLANS